MKNKLLTGLYKRGNVFWLSWRIQGKRYRESLDTADEGEAVLRALQRQSSPGLILSRQLDREISDYFAARVRSGGMRPITRNSQRGMLKNFTAFAAAQSLADLTPKAIRAWYDQRCEKVSVATADLNLKVVRAFCAWLVKNGRLRSNPAADVRPQTKLAPARIEFAGAKQVDALIAAAPSVAMRFVLLAGFDAGLRRNEIVEARREWFDLEGGSIFIRPTETFAPKNKRSRVVPLTERFVDFMREHFAELAPGAFILAPEKAAATSTSPRVNLNIEFDAFMLAQSVPWITPHTMRRTFASLRVSAGVSIYKVAAWIGDRLNTTERHYAHLVPVDSDIERVHRPAPRTAAPSSDTSPQNTTNNETKTETTK